ncbi:unnamed protein product [Brachionus calyciflorus]|uniref:Uncharacterized protein n=1 Tax=Brachionus calyciflorus TaxID=104777 RepID=A0A814M0A2_9BILA|nr:unnamed protein product [Brachionus calyciflorus]
MENSVNYLAKLEKIDLYFCVENVLCSIGPICSIIAARNGKKAWLKCEILISVVLGLLLIFNPSLLMSYMFNSKLEEYHFFLCSLYGFYIIYSIFTPLYLLNSLDESVFYGHHWAKIISSTLIIFDQIFSYNEGIHWKYKVFCLLTPIFITNLAINVYYLLKTNKPWGRHPYTDTVNCIARIDTFVFLITGIIMYAFPKSMCDLAFLNDENKNDLNDSYKSLCRASGAILLSLSLESYCLSEFLFLRDKKQFMLARLVGGLLKTLILSYDFIWLSKFSVQAFLMFFTICTSYNLIVLYGYLITPKEPFKTKKQSQ